MQNRRARGLWQQFMDSGQFASKVAAELIRPNIARINQRLGQENNPSYSAHAVEYVFSQAEL